MNDNATDFRLLIVLISSIFLLSFVSVKKFRQVFFPEMTKTKKSQLSSHVSLSVLPTKGIFNFEPIAVNYTTKQLLRGTVSRLELSSNNFDISFQIFISFQSLFEATYSMTDH